MDNDFRKTLKKKERLSVGTDLSRLFASGRYGITDGFRYCYRIGNELPFNRIVVSVPKKCFRRAVKRNLLKRRIREAYRLNKNLLPVNAEKGGTDILFIYSSKDILDFNAVVLSVRNILEGLAAKVTAMDATPKYSPGEAIQEAPDAAQKETLDAAQKDAPEAVQKDIPEEMQKETALQLKEVPETTRKETQQEKPEETPESDEQH
ncbi:riibonuclease P [Bacteroides sp. CAG:545]|nr:riibonuclease P [Bacteroides sp. CAG:545]